MPPPMWPVPHAIDPLPPDLRREYRAEPVPPETDGFMTDVDAALVQQIFDVLQLLRQACVIGLTLHFGRAPDKITA